MKVLGIDPGLTRCGIGVVELLPGRKVRLVHVDVARTPAGFPLAVRLQLIHDHIRGAIEAHQPDAMAVERVFAQANVRTVMGTAQVSGVALLIAAQLELPVATYTPTEVKSAVTGHGRANKEQVTSMVTRILRLPTSPTPADAADALAIAICHGWRGLAQQQLAAAATKVRP